MYTGGMIILAIETSCDETSVAVVENGQHLRSLVINSQIDLHKAFGGVVPEVAARSHVEVMIPVIKQALDEAFGSPQISNIKYQISSDPWSEIDAVAVTQGPGLAGSLLIGVLTARTLAWSLNKPLIPVHHILGHVYANWITDVNSKAQVTNIKQLPTSVPKFPVLALIVSGGHSQLMLGTDHNNWRVIGRTQDDAVGEAFDKVAKVLGLPYPGGPSIAAAAEGGNPNKYQLPTPVVTSIDPGLVVLRTEGGDQKRSAPTSHLISQTSYNFSFSGLKTAVLRAVQKECGVPYDFPSFELSKRLSDTLKADFAASFQKTAINYLVSKTKAAFDEFQPLSVIIGGGVAASLPLRQALTNKIPIEIQYAPLVLCTDNAAMIGARAFFQNQFESPIDPHQLEIKPSWPL